MVQGTALLLAFFVVPYLLLRYRVRTVQVNGFFESLLLGPLRLAGCKAIFTMHIPFETELYSWFRNPERYFPRLLSKHSLRFASQVVCVSETIGDIARTVLPEEKVTVIANWVETSAPVRISSSKAERPKLLFVGRLEEYKGAQIILQAMRRFLTRPSWLSATGRTGRNWRPRQATWMLNSPGSRLIRCGFTSSRQYSLIPPWGLRGCRWFHWKRWQTGFPASSVICPCTGR